MVNSYRRRDMATLELSLRRLILAGGFAVAVAAAPAIAVVTVPSASVPVAQCPGGEEEDIYTGVCVPHTVPNSGASFSSIPGNPDLPAVDGVPCTGHNSGQCIGLAEESESMGPQPVPRSTVSSSP
jgi:hypothetical protein